MTSTYSNGMKLLLNVYLQEQFNQSGGGGGGGEYIPKQLEVLLLIHNLISVYLRKWNGLPGAPFTNMV